MTIEWAVPANPIEDPDAGEHADSADPVVLSHPFVTQYGMGYVQTPMPSPKRFITGAVYTASGELVTASQRIGGYSGDQYIAADLPKIPPRRVQSSLDRFGRGSDRSGSTSLEGVWLYGGHWMDHFGHFISETLTSIPVETGVEEEVRGIVFHPTLPTRHASVNDWRDRLSELAGIPTRRHVASRGDVFPERLVVARRRLSLNAFARPGATAVWDRVRDAVVAEPDPVERIFFSRRRFETALAEKDPNAVNNRASLAWDGEALEASFERAGFHVVHPEELSIDEQVRTVANASVIAGGSGTALHLSAFATAATRVLELGDLRTGTRPLPNQRVICAARGQELAYIPADPASEQSQDERLDRIFSDLF